MWQECGITKLGHKLVLAKGIIALFGPQVMDMAGQLGDAKKNAMFAKSSLAYFLRPDRGLADIPCQYVCCFCICQIGILLCFGTVL